LPYLHARSDKVVHGRSHRATKSSFFNSIGAIETFKIFARLDEIAQAQGIAPDDIEVRFSDERRIGQKNLESQPDGETSF
jgi:hypothetical protein